ncbi:uncharacterized protein LAESUDRAFT_758641 [Laetiporus sulphureus 93-53]|uniref:DNA polymerase delta subunit 4 n=1 Tax=Laetiporus sulphureus 93-53 TaxID=1314785 RepID=A0A165EKB8_9APHY|nr:uncharacterized protein LAESUDRAFT_758641 [Laetiporus sulphureus 93-53]KZT07235.1 hypothetical protein LAESUDRAFT_758641 [Laetiporus sulphureus 93-53]
MTPRKHSLEGDASPPLKQGKLSFRSSKRAASTGSANSAKGKGSRPGLKRRLSSISTVIPEVIEAYDTEPSEAKSVDEHESAIEVSSSEEDGGKRLRGRAARKEDHIEEAEEPMTKRRRLRKDVFGSREGLENAHGHKQPQASPAKRGRKKGKGKVVKGKKLEEEEEEKEEVGNEEEVEGGHLNVKHKKWNKLYGEVREKNSHLEFVHGEGLNKVDHILRMFDLTYDFGPCIGVTRLQRWQRAEMLGLKPPPEIKEILLTKEGSEEPRYRECVFFGEV